MVENTFMSDAIDSSSQKRHNSHEGRSKSGSAQNRSKYIGTHSVVYASALDKRNYYPSKYQEKKCRGGKRHLQPRQNPVTNQSPRNNSKYY
jgi:subtilase family serine protease